MQLFILFTESYRSFAWPLLAEHDVYLISGESQRRQGLKEKVKQKSQLFLCLHNKVSSLDGKRKLSLDD